MEIESFTLLVYTVIWTMDVKQHSSDLAAFYIHFIQV